MHNFYTQYSDIVETLLKPGVDIRDSLTPEEANLWHLATGVVGEAGELIDAVKKHVVYRKPLDMDNMVEELGDLEFFMEGLRQAIGVTREKCLEANVEKLAVRYSGLTYSDKSAQDRADKA